MATQFKDGSFSEAKPFQDALEDFLGFVDEGKAVAFFVGDPREIRKEQQKATLEKQIEMLTERIESLEKDRDKVRHSMSIYLPNQEEVIIYGNLKEKR